MRVLLVPFFVVEILYYVRSGVEMHRTLGLLCFAVAAIFDGVDGYIARHYNQKSELGAILDPLADKLLLISGIILLSFEHPNLGSIPYWLSGTIIGRDLLLLIGMAVIYMTVGKVKVRPRIVGKVATVLQMAAILMVLLKWDEGQGAKWFLWVVIGATACTALSGLLYLFDGMKQLGSHPSSSAAADQNKPLEGV
jgi:cardiolipin synthase